MSKSKIRRPVLGCQCKDHDAKKCIAIRHNADTTLIDVLAAYCKCSCHGWDGIATQRDVWDERVRLAMR